MAFSGTPGKWFDNGASKKLYDLLGRVPKAAIATRSPDRTAARPKPAPFGRILTTALLDLGAPCVETAIPR
jgi:hypothetical protein